jgi:flavin-binding protein dodecin
MAGSLYKLVELVGTSSESWQRAAASAVSRVSKAVRDLGIADVEGRAGNGRGGGACRGVRLIQSRHESAAAPAWRLGRLAWRLIRAPTRSGDGRPSLQAWSEGSTVSRARCSSA